MSKTKDRRKVKNVTVPDVPIKVMNEVRKHCKKEKESVSKTKTEALLLGFKEKGLIDDVKEKD